MQTQLISYISHFFCPPPTGRTIFPLSNSLFSQIDVLVNNGGRSQRSLCAETNLDVFQALMDLNFLGTVSITKRVLPHMMLQGRGSIVTVSSIVGLAGAPLQTGYTASKHALQVRVTQTPPTVCVTAHARWLDINAFVLAGFLQFPSHRAQRLPKHTYQHSVARACAVKDHPQRFQRGSEHGTIVIVHCNRIIDCSYKWRGVKKKGCFTCKVFWFRCLRP